MSKKINQNFLDIVPKKASFVKWSSENDIVTLEIENKGLFNKLAQKLLNKPKISYIHLDKTGSFIWTKINGVDNVATIGKMLDEQFGKEAHPLYERLVKYISILKSYNFIEYTK